MPIVADPLPPTARIEDAAVAHVIDADEDLVVAIDTLVDGVHFPTATAPVDVGFKALAVNLSDLAAMGATPRAVRVSITHPDSDSETARSW